MCRPCRGPRTLYGIDGQRGLRLMHTNKLRFPDETTNFFIVIPEGIRRVRIKNLGSHIEPRAAAPGSEE